MNEHAATTESVPAVDDLMLQRIAAGSREAFQQLYRTVAPNIYAFALTITKNPHDAEDVVQETMLAVYRQTPSYQSRGKPMAWIFTIARNFALRCVRSRRNTIPLEELWNVEGDGERNIEAAESKMVLDALLCALSVEEQQIIILHAVHGMKNREIADILDLPLNTVLSKYHRAIKKMRKRMEGERV